MLYGQGAIRGAHTTFDDMVQAVGATNVAAAHGVTGFRKISSEQLIQWNPDVIITSVNRDAPDETRRQLLHDPAVAVTTAGKHQRIIVIPNRIFLTVTHHITQGIAQLARALPPRVMNLRTTIRRAGATVPAAPPRHRTATRVCSALLVLLLLAILAGMSVGSISVAPVTVATVLAASVFPHGWIDVSSVSEADRVVVWLIRTPRVLVAALVGAAWPSPARRCKGSSTTR